MPGFHMQNPTRNWLDHVAILPPGTALKVVNDYFMARDAKLRNQKLLTVFRHVADGQQNPSDNHEENRQKARAFFATFIDGTWWDQKIYQYVNVVEEWNEYLADSMPDSERARWLSWNLAVQQVWREYQIEHPELLPIRLCCCNTAVGNSIPWQFAKQVADFGNVLGYHGYTHYNPPNLILRLIVNSRAFQALANRSAVIADRASGVSGTRDPLDWTYHSGRWVGMDAEYRARGIKVQWLITEGGPYYSVFDGWRSPNVLNGDLERYLVEVIKYQLDRTTAWNKLNGDRYLGQCLFTASNDKQWAKYNLGDYELEKIAGYVAAYNPPAPDPEPDPGDPDEAWKARARQASIDEQKARGIRLNPKVGIQSYMFKQGGVPAGAFVPVHNELPFEGWMIQGWETLDGSQPRVVAGWMAGRPILVF